MKLIVLMMLIWTLAMAPVSGATAVSDAPAGQREFILSCVYGSVAGTLVGLASLAFTDKPNQNLNKVARGASLGLYAGIALGLYVVYGTSEDDEDPVVLAPAPVIDLDGRGDHGGLLVTQFSF